MNFLIVNAKDLEFVFLSSKDADIRDLNQTKSIFDRVKPTYVIHLAAIVGGLFANMENKVKFFEDNMMINMNVVKCSYDAKVKRLLCCLSTCIFPDAISYPIKESDLQ
jgi:GDP-L-fucose synthase